MKISAYSRVLALSGFALAATWGAASAATLRATVPEYSAKTGPYFKQVAKAFEKANPDITVQFEVVPWDSLQQKLTTDISSNSNADLTIVSSRWLVDFVQQGIAEPLDGYLTPSFKKRFFPAFLGPATMNGKTYGLPMAASARAMFYNKTLFEKAGIDKPPETWSELKSDAEKISALGDGVYGFGIQGAASETDLYFDYVLRSYGGGILRKDGTSGFDTPAAIQAAGMYKSLIDSKATEPGVTSHSRADLQNLFKRGKLGMVITAPFLSNQIKSEAPDLKYGVAAIPSGPKGDHGTYGVTDTMFMFQNSRHKEEVWKFIDFLMQKKWRSVFTKNEGFLPVNQEVAKEPYFQNNADLKAFTSLLPDARFLPLIPNWQKIASIEVNALQTIYLGNAEIEPTLKQAAAEANKLLNPS